MQQRRDRVQWVYGAKNNRELGERYDEWANEYDKDLREEFDWIAPRVTVALFGKYVAPDARVLDAGVGTGLVGECLIDAGYRQLHGIDLSVGMLDAARCKAIYRELRQMTLGEPLDFADDTFDAVISVGVFHRSRPGSCLRRACPHHEGRRAHLLLAQDRASRGGIRSVPRWLGGRCQVEVGGTLAALPPDAQGRTGSRAPGLGLSGTVGAGRVAVAHLDAVPGSTPAAKRLGPARRWRRRRTRP